MIHRSARYFDADREEQIRLVLLARRRVTGALRIEAADDWVAIDMDDIRGLLAEIDRLRAKLEAKA